MDYRLLHWIVIVVLHGVFWARTAVAESPCDGVPNGFLKRFAICRCPEFFDDFTKPTRDQRCSYNERIETERHDFTQSATTVGRHVVQIESGYSYFQKETVTERESVHAFPEMLLRIGLTEDIEVRIRWNHIWNFISQEQDRIGSEDLRYSLKLQLTRQQEWWSGPTTAVELRGLAPTGNEYSTGNAEFSFDYIYHWQLSRGWSVAGSTAVATNGFGEYSLVPDLEVKEQFTAFAQSAVVGYELGDLNTMYFEWYGIFTDGLQNEKSVSVLNLGIDHYLSRNFVVDARIGFGLTEDSDDFFAGFGGGYRF